MPKSKIIYREFIKPLSSANKKALEIFIHDLMPDEGPDSTAKEYFEAQPTEVLDAIFAEVEQRNKVVFTVKQRRSQGLCRSCGCAP